MYIFMYVSFVVLMTFISYLREWGTPKSQTNSIFIHMYLHTYSYVYNRYYLYFLDFIKINFNKFTNEMCWKEHHDWKKKEEYEESKYTEQTNIRGYICMYIYIHTYVFGML